MIRLPIGYYVEKAIDWLTYNLDSFSMIKTILLAIINSFEFIFTGIPFIVMLLIFVIISWKVAGRNVAIFTAIGLVIIKSINLWQQTMSTFALVATATVIAIVIGIPLGIWMSFRDTVNSFVRPILDFMQTMPAFVYLIPAVYF